MEVKILLLDEIKELLQTIEKYFSKEGDLLKNTILEDVIKMDNNLIKLLLSNKSSKSNFFIEMEETLIFDKDKFIKFIENKEFLPNSYTAFKNKIGLTNSAREFIKEKNDVVLSWAYRDCYLEGGQNKEDLKKDEVFYNEILAPDEIDRLLEPKILTNFKKYDKDGEHKEVEDITLEDNLIIKGNNLLALHTLKEKYAGQIKVIYIDPPYNTGSDSFKYNDRFSRSTWLTFMKNRLEVAKDLLKDDGAIFVQCDNNEQSYLKVLMDEIFGEINFKNNIIWRKVLSAKKQSTNLSNVTEFILLYSKTEKFRINKLFLKAEEAKDLKNYPHTEKETGRRYGSFDFTQKGQGEAKYFNGELLSPPKGKHWIWGQEQIDEGIENNKIIFTKNGTPRVKRYLDEKEGNPLSDLWNDDSVKIISANDRERFEFDGQKPEGLLKRIIELSTDENDIILDYHLGTGTTCAVAHKMKRRYIGIEQMEYIEEHVVERLKKVIEGEQIGVSKKLNWQGGGSFIYCELMKWNETFIDNINKAKTKDELLEFLIN